MYKGFKKVIFLMLVLASVFTLITSSAFAVELTDTKIEMKMDKANDYIFAEIEKAQNEAEKEVLKAEKKNLSEEELDLIIDKIIEKLVNKTEHKVNILIEKAEKSGITLEKKYIEVNIYDRVVLVDPFYAH